MTLYEKLKQRLREDTFKSFDEKDESCYTMVDGKFMLKSKYKPCNIIQEQTSEEQISSQPVMKTEELSFEEEYRLFIEAQKKKLLEKSE